MDPVTLILQQVISTVIIDKTKISRGVYEKVTPLTNELKTWLNLFDGINVEEPMTWVKTGMRVAGALVETEKLAQSPIDNFLKKHKYTVEAADSILFVGESIMGNSDPEVVIEQDDRSLCSIAVGDVKIYATLVTDQYILETIHFPADKEKREKCHAAIRELFWSNKDHVFVDMDDEGFEVSVHQFVHNDYQGELLGELENLQKFVDAEIRRVVIFQGVPGTGKSTLCAHAARNLSDRTVVFNNEAISHVSKHEWEALIGLLKPKMVIIDDIDRVYTNLGRSLFMFEDAYYHVPITLFTTNDMSVLPEAFRRPGRVDQIINMPDPPSWVRNKLMNEIAERENITDIPKDKVLIFDQLLEHKPGAHSVELMRRYKALGWDYEVPECDMVFSEIMKEINDSLACSHEVLSGGRLGVVGKASSKGK